MAQSWWWAAQVANKKADLSLSYLFLFRNSWNPGTQRAGLHRLTAYPHRRLTAYPLHRLSAYPLHRLTAYPHRARSPISFENPHPHNLSPHPCNFNGKCSSLELFSQVLFRKDFTKLLLSVWEVRNKNNMENGWLDDYCEIRGPLCHIFFNIESSKFLMLEQI